MLETPILHRKETFVPAGYPQRDKFARLTAQEERWGLYQAPARIGTREGWRQVLAEQGVALRGHRVVRLREINDDGNLPHKEV